MTLQGVFSGHGDYRHLESVMFLGGDASTLEAHLTSLHELMHADLDNTSDYGTLLSCYAFMARAAPERLRARMGNSFGTAGGRMRRMRPSGVS